MPRRRGRGQADTALEAGLNWRQPGWKARGDQTLWFENPEAEVMQGSISFLRLKEVGPDLTSDFKW